MTRPDRTISRRSRNDSVPSRSKCRRSSGRSSRPNEAHGLTDDIPADRGCHLGEAVIFFSFQGISSELGLQFGGGVSSFAVGYFYWIRLRPGSPKPGFSWLRRRSTAADFAPSLRGRYPPRPSGFGVASSRSFTQASAACRETMTRPPTSHQARPLVEFLQAPKAGTTRPPAKYSRNCGIVYASLSTLGSYRDVSNKQTRYGATRYLEFIDRGLRR